jgi:molybdenum cofactor cytidylyltransferase
MILAAGRGERFRAAGGTDKLQEILLGRRVRDWVTQAARDSGLPWHVVEAAHTAHIANPGMGDSIACGVAATAGAAGWLVLPADLPLIQASSLLAVAKALQDHTVVLPFCAGQRGHPVGFGPQAREELLALRGDGGAASVVAAALRARPCTTDDGSSPATGKPENSCAVGNARAVTTSLLGSASAAVSTGARGAA